MGRHRAAAGGERARKSIPTRCKWAEGGAKLSGVEAIRGFNQTHGAAPARRAAVRQDRLPDLADRADPGLSGGRCSPGDDPERPFEHIAFTVPWNFSEQPAVSINGAFTTSGLPIGVQIIGRRHDDHGVLKLAKA